MIYSAHLAIKYPTNAMVNYKIKLESILVVIGIYHMSSHSN